MLRNLKELHDYAIGATDGEVGHVKDVYFDDQAWVVRYLVVDTGGWLSGRKVLISPMAVGTPNWETRQLPVSITKQQVENSPGFDSAKPVTRQHEMEYSGYYGYPKYWGGIGYWGAGMYPNMVMSSTGGFGTQRDIAEEVENARLSAEARDEDNADPHLRSADVVTGYHIHASDGDIGHVCGMLIDDETWAVRYLIVDTSNWWLGHQMLVAPQWIDSVNWADRTVAVKLTRQAVEDAPAYDSATKLLRGDEVRLYEHYGRSGYWTVSDKRETDISRI
ncbi:MAG: PRC-barrel domain-containing protein [Rhodoferax sp.]